MARATKPGWCCYCRPPDRPACGGRPQSKNCWYRRVRCLYMSSLCGSQSCRPIGRDPAAWFNPESQTRGLSSIGTMTISSQVSCIASFPRSLDAASARAYFGIWLRCTGHKRNGAILRLSSQTVPLCFVLSDEDMAVQRKFLERVVVSYPLLTINGQVPSLYRDIARYPAIFLIDREGKLQSAPSPDQPF
jgi:hypothetical protein